MKKFINTMQSPLYPIGTIIVLQDKHQAQRCGDILGGQLESWCNTTKNWSKGFNPLNNEWRVMVDGENQRFLSNMPFMLNEKIACIRRGLCLDRTEASRVFGLGSKAFFRFEAKNIKPRQSVLRLLQVVWDHRCSQDFYDILFTVCHYAADAIRIEERIRNSAVLDVNSQKYQDFYRDFSQSFNVFCENRIEPLKQNAWS